MPVSKGLCFVDRDRGPDRRPAEPRPDNNCYLKLCLNYESKNVRPEDFPEVDGIRPTFEEVREIVLSFTES